ncbi:MAG: tRNA (adenosine(37)-N6)-dimethylallyltransferase MiaA, partial [Pseudomonadota bacterium]
KPPPDLLAEYPHALIDIRDPAEVYSVAEFIVDADAAVRRAFDAGRIPLLVGGTMLYLKAFREGIAAMPAADAEVRDRLLAEAEEHGTKALYERLQRVDPEAAARIHPNNFPRIQRALEVYELTGETISSHWNTSEGVGARLDAVLLEFGIEPDSREQLHARIESRLDEMLAGGFIDEVAGLKKRHDLHPELPSMRAVGYRQVWEHLDGLTDFDEMRENALAATRQLAKRQLTWMRGWTQLLNLKRGTGDKLAEQIGLKSGLNR